MNNQSFLTWLSTTDQWWNDSAAPVDIAAALKEGAVGVTTNPVLASRVVGGDLYEPDKAAIAECGGKAEARVQKAVLDACDLMKPVWEASNGRRGYVCAQVNPAFAHDREQMLATARTYRSWSPQIAVKLPTCAAGLDVLEECAAEGIPTTMTVSFCVPQAVASAERHLKGCRRAEQAGLSAVPSWAVIMIGRLDDYLRDAVADCGSDITEEQLRWAGVAVTKRTAFLFDQMGARAEIMVAALRQPYHVATLLGGGIVFSIAPGAQKQLTEADIPKRATIGEPVEQRIIDRLRSLPAFISSYEADGMAVEELYGYAPFQRTATQFYYGGWLDLER